MRRPSIIILGAGAAGLAAAQSLSDAGISTLILEARDRIGGRILTLPRKDFGVPVQMGAEFVHGRPEVTWQLIRNANLTAYDVPFDHRHRRRGRLAHLKDFSAELKKVMGGLSHLGSHDISFAEYLRKYHNSPKLADARKFAINFVEGFDAADPERISSQSVAEEQRGLADFDDQTQFRLLEGYGKLIEHLHGSLDRKHVKILLQTPVNEIKWERGEVEVRSGRKRFYAQHLLVTLPLGILQLLPETPGAVRFEPDLPEKRRAAMQLGSGPIVKMLLKFREPFWEDPAVAKAARADATLSQGVFFHDSTLLVPTWWTMRPLRLAVLTGWAGGPMALALSGQSRHVMQQAAIESLGTLFNLKKPKLWSLLEAFEFADWPADPWARGAYSYVTVGGARARALLAKPIQNTLFFAGEATDTSGQASTVAGALASGQRAGREIIAAVR